VYAAAHGNDAPAYFKKETEKRKGDEISAPWNEVITLYPSLLFFFSFFDIT